MYEKFLGKTVWAQKGLDHRMGVVKETTPTSVILDPCWYMVEAGEGSTRADVMAGRTAGRAQRLPGMVLLVVPDLEEATDLSKRKIPLP